MGLDFSDPRFWFDVVQTAVIFLLWLRRPGEGAAKRVEDLERASATRIGEIEKHMAVMKEQLANVPRNDELSEIEGSIKALLVQVHSVSEQIVDAKKAVTRIEDWLRQRSA